MITVGVCGVDHVLQFAQANITDIVSIGDPGSFRPDTSGYKIQPKLHRFDFVDVSHEWEFGPLREHVQRVINLADHFIARKEDARILFHCAAGISRSTASAFITLVRAGLGYQEAHDYILKQRGILRPNLLMIKHADVLMGHGGKMLDFIVNARTEYKEDALEWLRVNGHTFA